ncbi:lipase family alpha/beta hydrolase [Gandjariella thermophila]|uniref:Lipase n=1 Tax=Gandjariella thermophila TaxID=1931992 RepID=A0A4D4JD73_9PSEU|nr:alpha/beta fold hydrolase [Gandjariella thermophila]GDY33584.1 lipase [Gandjariella thermophila]
MRKAGALVNMAVPPAASRVALLRGVVLEAAWTIAQVALFPIGFRDERTDLGAPDIVDEPPGNAASPPRDAAEIDARQIPILLVHGFACNRAVFTLLRRGLRRRGFGHLVAMNYSPLTTEVRLAAEALAKRVEQVCAETGAPKVHVVGHSLGGLIGRYYVQRLGGDRRVDTLFTLGTPHQGTFVARLLTCHPLVRQLRPDSELIRELAEPAPGCRTRFVAFYSDVDQLVVPATHACVNHPDLTARNVLVRGVFHNTLSVNSDVMEVIYAELGAGAPADAGR